MNGIANGGENVVSNKWEKDEPADREGLGAAMMASSSHDKWSTRNFDESLGKALKTLPLPL